MNIRVKSVFSILIFLVTLGSYAANFSLTYSVQNVSCFNGSDGSITVNVHPATPADYKKPYTYTWYEDIGLFLSSEVSDDTTATLSNIPAGTTYLVLVKDGDGIQRALLNIIVTQPPELTLSSSITDITCFGSSDGAIDITVLGGTPPYIYNWVDGTGSGSVAGLQNQSGLTAGTYYLTVTDFKSCILEDTLTVGGPSAGVSGSISSITHVACFGDATGSVTIAGSGGISPYEYSKDGGAYQASGTFTNLAADSYTITVKDDNDCTFDVPVTITQPAVALSGSITSQTNVACFGDATGSVTVAGADGTSPYQYSLDGGAYQSSGTFNSLAASSYTVIVKDNNDCTFNIPVTITQPASGVSGNISSQTDVLCFGDATGSVTVVGSGGTSPYQYKLGAGGYQPSGTFPNLSAASYTITVKDNNDCTFDVPVTITQPVSAVSGSISSQTDVLCFGDATGSVTVAGSGGTSPYQYKLDAGSYQASGTFSLLSAGNYTVTVQDNNLCTFDLPITITEPPTVVSGSIVSQTIACFGEATGSVTVIGSGGTPPYQYKLGAGAFQSSGTFTGLSAGNYTITVRDTNLCAFDVPVTISEAATSLSGSITLQTNVACFGESTGAVTITGSGGTLPYEYSLDGGAYQSSGSFSNLSAGSYTITVQDANLCTFDVPVTITEPGSALSGNIVTQTDVLCFGEATGSVTVAGAGGTPLYEYSLDGGTYQSSGTFNTLSAGNYTVTVQDANLCTFDVPVTITQPATGLSGNISDQTDVLCFGDAAGEVTVAGNGGALPYEYQLDGGSYQASGTFSGLLAGNHTVTIQDGNLCTFNVPVTINQPPSAVAGTISSQINILCFGDATGSVTVAGSGGIPPYEYSLDGGSYQASGTFNGISAGNHTVIVQDGNLCTFNVPVTITEPVSAVSGSISSQTDVACFGETTGSVTIAGSGGTPTYEYSLDGGTYQSSGTFNTLSAGNYTITVRDANLCTFDVPVTITEPLSAVSGSITSQTDVICPGGSTGSVTAAGAGGTPPYEYSLDGGIYQSSGTFNTLSAGNYTITVQDGNFCTADVPVAITEPPVLIATISSTNISCFGKDDGTILVAASGGTPGYVYTLKKGVPIVGSNINGSFTGLLPGTDYTIEVTDTNGCGPFISNLISISEPTPVNITSETAYDITCNGANDGRIDIIASGGTSPYTYSINGGPPFVDNGGNFTGLSANTYTVAVKDTMDCMIIGGIHTINDPAALSLITDTTKATCNFGTPDGSMRLSVTGGVPSYEYSIDNGLNYQADTSFTGLLAGMYDVVIKDNNNCLLSESVEIEGRITVTAYAGEDVSVCPGTQYTLYASGGDSYFWSSTEGISDPTSDTIVVSPVGITNYFLTATKELCEDKDTVILSNYPVLGIDAGSDTTVQAGGSVVLTATTGFASYLWLPPEIMSDPFGSSITVTPLGNTMVLVTGTTPDGCLESDSLQIFIAQELVIPSGFTPNNDGVNDTWEITNSQLYPDMMVDIFTRWGAKIFHVKGYNADTYWDGTHNGKDLPMGTYYYVIQLNDPYGTKPITGPLTIIR